VAAHEMNAEAAHVGRLPGFGRHLVSGGIEPGDFLRLIAVEALAVEEAAAVERGLVVVDGDEAADER